MSMNTALSLLNIKEDLLDDEVGNFEPKTINKQFTLKTTTDKEKTTRTKKIKVEVSTFEKLLATSAKTLGCIASELTTWLNQIPKTPEIVQLNALKLITKHSLDPFADEITINQYEDGHWQAFITIDGWSRLINSHPAFSGISFTESDELNGGVPSWMGCAIYRNDRVVPIEVKEYLCEIQTEHSIWKGMPRRMLRHRVIAQCARLAFGVSVPENNRLNKIKLGEKELVVNNGISSNKNSQMKKLKIRLKS